MCISPKHYAWKSTFRIILFIYNCCPYCFNGVFKY